MTWVQANECKPDNPPPASVCEKCPKKDNGCPAEKTEADNADI